MITPALLILASASLVATALVRMARVVDRARLLVSIAHDGTWNKLGIGPEKLQEWLSAHQRRARNVGITIATLYASIVVFVATVLSIALDRALGDALSWLPVSLAILGALLLLVAGAYMVEESRSSARQITDEIQNAVSTLKERQ